MCRSASKTIHFCGIVLGLGDEGEVSIILKIEIL